MRCKKRRPPKDLFFRGPAWIAELVTYIRQSRTTLLATSRHPIMINVWQQAERAERGEARRRSGACERRAPHRAVNAACFAACRGRLEESWRIPLRLMIGVTSVRLMSCPTASVPTIKANDAEPRIQPYSNSFPVDRGLAALTDNASANEVVGAREAAWTMAIKSSNAKDCAHNKVAADADANAAQTARASRSDPVSQKQPERYAPARAACLRRRGGTGSLLLQARIRILPGRNVPTQRTAPRREAGGREVETSCMPRGMSQRR
jgi:hypothetical protein